MKVKKKRICVDAKNQHAGGKVRVNRIALATKMCTRRWKGCILLAVACCLLVAKYRKNRHAGGKSRVGRMKVEKKQSFFGREKSTRRWQGSGEPDWFGDENVHTPVERYDFACLLVVVLWTRKIDTPVARVG